MPSAQIALAAQGCNAPGHHLRCGGRAPEAGGKRNVRIKAPNCISGRSFIEILVSTVRLKQPQTVELTWPVVLL